MSARLTSEARQPGALIGTPRSRVDGRAKVTGTARYAAETQAEGLLHGVIVGSEIARGRIRRIDDAEARALPGVIAIYTHENRPRTAWFSFRYQDDAAPPGTPLRPLVDDAVTFVGQPIALVVAEDSGTALHAASLVKVEYAEDEHQTDLGAARSLAYEPPKKRQASMAPPKPRGDADTAFADAPVKIEGEYVIAREVHNPMEMHAATVIFGDDGAITVHEKTQGAQNTQRYLAAVFGLSKDKVRVVSPYVGGAFGSGLRPQHHLFLTVMASLDLERSVRVEMSRRDMFSHVHRPWTINRVALGARADGTLTAIRHQAIQGTSRYEDHQEAVVNWSGLLYRCDNVTLTYKLAQLDTSSPGDMRAPGAPLGIFAMECAMDELAAGTGIDPVALRLANYAEEDQNDGKPFTSKELRACYELGAERFGWSRRTPEPRSMKEGRELVGWGMASGAWDAQMQQTTARAVLDDNGVLTVSTATADIGTGTYTILSQIAGETLGVAIENVKVEIGDSDLPTSPLEGGSWTAASAGSAVQAACIALREQLLLLARRVEHSPLANAGSDHVLFRDGRIVLASDPDKGVSAVDALKAAGLPRIQAEETAGPDKTLSATKSSYTHQAVFAEVRVDEELGQVRVTRVVSAVAAGRIVNPKTARSQILGGVVWGIGMALHEETIDDHRLGRFMNRDFAEYHLPVNADIHDIDVLFVDEHDEGNPLGIKGLGEIGIVGTAAAIANAVWHATGKRIRDLPITLDKLVD